MPGACSASTVRAEVTASPRTSSIKSRATYPVKSQPVPPPPDLIKFGERLCRLPIRATVHTFETPSATLCTTRIQGCSRTASGSSSGTSENVAYNTSPMQQHRPWHCFAFKSPASFSLLCSGTRLSPSGITLITPDNACRRRMPQLIEYRPIRNRLPFCGACLHMSAIQLFIT